MRSARAVGVVAAVLLTLSVPARVAGAVGDGGASSRVIGRGNIVTSILGWTVPSRARPSGVAPACSWRTLTDTQLEWLISVAAQPCALGLSAPMLEPVLDLVRPDVLPDGDLQGYVCGVHTHELRFVPSDATADPTQLLLRQMITRLPAPDPVVSPPAESEIPVGQPVFVSIDQRDWRPIEASLSHSGTTAEVRARPVELRLISGDPRGATVSCDGRGRPFRAGTGRSPRQQAGDPDTCTMTYRTPTDGTDSRPSVWLGTITVVWHAEWRTDGGAWNDLGRIPRTRLVARIVREVSTTLDGG